MIKLERIRTKEAIASGLRGDGRVKKNLDLLKLKRELLKSEGEEAKLPSKKFKSNLWKPAKKQLIAESHGKCAYCEADTKVVAHGDVEHFRPKTVYWWLAYCYDNYLYSCQICNQTFKSNKFPVSGSPIKGPKVGKRTTDAQLNKLAKMMTPDPLDPALRKHLDEFIAKAIDEEADLIDPYITDPEDWLVWEADDNASEVWVKVKPRAKNRAAKQEAIDDVYGLNREELRKTRYLVYTTAKTFMDLIEQTATIVPAAAELSKDGLRKMTANDSRYAGMTRYFVKKKWKLDLS